MMICVPQGEMTKGQHAPRVWAKTRILDIKRERGGGGQLGSTFTQEYFGLYVARSKRKKDQQNFAVKNHTQ